MSDDYLWDKSGKPDPDVSRLEEALAPLRHEGEWREPPRRLFARRAWIAGGALALAAAIALAIGVLRPWEDGADQHAQGAPTAPTAPTSMAPSVSALAVSAPVPAPSLWSCAPASSGFGWEAPAEVKCDGALAQAGKLPPGAWLETPEGVTASLRVADIGAMQVRGGSKVRIVRTGENEHRLELVRGSVHAKVKAPPRLFVIDTRAATAVDLGCEYDLGVDDRGWTHLHVTKGAVALEGKDRQAIVPRGAQVSADPERGPLTVVSDGATPEMRAATKRLDDGDAKALADVLKNAGRGDSVTLWNLLASAGREARAEVVRKLDELKLRPVKVRREALIAGEFAALQALLEHLEDDWYVEPKTP